MLKINRGGLSINMRGVRVGATWQRGVQAGHVVEHDAVYAARVRFQHCQDLMHLLQRPRLHLYWHPQPPLPRVLLQWHKYLL